MFTDNLTSHKHRDEKIDIMNGLSLIRFSVRDNYADEVNQLAQRTSC
jgi:hypothetical protein